jgi:hypothetical protein
LIRLKVVRLKTEGGRVRIQVERLKVDRLKVEGF